ncbi:uncharacterized protein TNCV_3601131 [Trichonephila clavipes]|nr:uncharacterized protein TNCV_3601131 [Trichonephila clavipes]
MMNYCLKILYVCITCGLLALELHFVDSAEIGDGSMNYEDFDRCFRTISCYLGDDAYMETRACYEIMTPQNYIEAVDIVRTAAADANLTFEADNLDDQRTEYCAYTEDEKVVSLDSKRQVGQIGESFVIRVEAMRPLEDADKNRWTLADFSFMMVAVDLDPQQIGRTD